MPGGGTSSVILRPEVLERMHGEDGAVLSAREWPGFSRAFTKAVDAAMKVRPLDRPATISAWLKMFDGEERDPEPIDEPTASPHPWRRFLLRTDTCIRDGVGEVDIAISGVETHAQAADDGVGYGRRGDCSGRGGLSRPPPHTGAGTPAAAAPATAPARLALNVRQRWTR